MSTTKRGTAHNSKVSIAILLIASCSMVLAGCAGIVSGNNKTANVPVTPALTAISPTSGSVGTSVTLAGSNFGSSQGTSTVSFNGTTATPTSWGASSVVVPVPAGATTGSVVVTVGGLASNGMSFTVTSSSPSITSLSPTSGVVGAAVTIAGSNFGASQGTSSVTFNGKTATPTSWSATSIVAAVPAGATTGSVVVTVGGVASNSVTFTVATAGPSISSLSPTSGVVGTPVTITGSNFGSSQGTSSVSFNGIIGAPTSWTATSIVVPVPTGATTGGVVVSVGGVASNGMTFTVTTPGPSISSLNPTSGVVGASVTVSGANFGSTQGSSTVKFSGTTGTPTSWSASSIVVPVPTGATTGSVVVTVGGVASNGVTFTLTTTPGPSISSLSPTSGAVGTSVTVTGSNFGSTQGTSTVTFNGTAGTPTSWSASTIVVPVPTSATTGNVVVTVGGVASNGVAFTVPVPTPSITGVSPTSGQVGTSVTVTGSNFGATKGSSTVKFNGTTGTPTSWSASSIVVPVPAGAATGSVVVTVGGAASNGVAFTVQGDTTPPTVPTALVATAVSSSQVNLLWTPSTDNVGVTGYNVLRNGSQIGTSASATFTDSGLQASTTYSYTVSAFDAAGNTSAQSASASATTLAASGGGGQIPNSLGWFDIPLTTLDASAGVICPTLSDIQGGSGCDAVMGAWGGGVADPTRNLMIIWGGGHVDYHGNEVYGVNLNSNPATRNVLRGASTGSNLANCTSGGGSNVETNPDGTPTSRHTYDGEVYYPPLDEYVMIGGSEMCNGGFSTSVWTLTPGSYNWQNSGLSLPENGNGGPFPLADYDPVNQVIYEYDNNLPEFYTINLNTKTITNLSTSFSGSTCTSGASGGNLYTAAIDPVNRFFYCVGTAGAWKISMNSPYTVTQLAMSGCASSTNAPGFAYYPVRKQFVEWAGGNTVYFYNQSTDSCTSVTYTGGPGSAQSEGTYGRFRYFPQLGVFILANSMTQDFFSLRLDTAADANFSFRVNQPGVLNTQGFDTTTIFSTTVDTSTPADGFGNSSTWTRDTTNFLSGSYVGGTYGASAAHCPIPAGFSGDNPCEDYWSFFGQGSNLVNIGQNTTFYVQFAFRADSGWVNTNWTNFGPSGDNTAPKIVIFDNVTSSCAQVEITTHYHDSKVPAAYTDCGANSITSSDGTTWDNNGQYWQQGWLSSSPFTGYQCAYNNGQFNTPNCFNFTPNQWYTLYYKVSVGTWGSPNSSIQAWVAPYGQQMKQWLSVTNYQLNNDNDCSANGLGPGSSTCPFNNLHLTQFMTGHGSGPGGSPAANVWYDELIISTKPISSPCLSGCSQP